jgi:hypothetical protein
MIRGQLRSIAAAFAFAALSWCFAASAAAQSSAAADPVPELRLPDLTEDARGIAPGALEAPLPDAPPLPPPEFEPPLPAVREDAIPASAYRTEATLDTSDRPGLGETFTEASIGAGLWSGISAALSIYRPLSDPSFGMTFSHDSLDGFAFHEPGTGFYERRTALSGRVRGEGAGIDAWSFTAAFEDRAAGLQGNSVDFSGVAHRYIDVSGSYRRRVGGLFGGDLGLEASGSAAAASRSLEIAAADPAGVLGFTELTLLPRVEASLEYSSLTVGFSASYAFRGFLGLEDDQEPSDRYSRRAAAELSIDWDADPALSLGASVAVANTGDFPVLVPFTVSVEAGLGSIAAFALDGGLRSDFVLLADRWKENPYLDLGPLPTDDARWFASSKVDFFLIPGLSARAAGTWERSLEGAGRLDPIAPLENDPRALYGYRLDEYHALRSDFSLRWQTGGARASAGWAYDWLDEPADGVRGRFSADLEYRDRGENFGAVLAASVGTGAEGAELPVLDASGFIRLGDELRVAAEFSDIAAAFSGSDGRTRWAPYLSTGFRGSLRILISL